MAGRYGVAVLISGLLGCAAPCVHTDRSRVSTGIETRTGYAIAEESGGDELSLPPGVSLDDDVSEDEVVALALWNNPDFQESLAELGVARADLIAAGLLSNPVLSVLFPLGPKQLEFTVTLPLEALLLRPRRLDIARLEADRVGERLVQSGLDVVRDVRVAYAERTLARDRARLAAEANQLASRIVELAERRLRAGAVSELEVAAARIDAARAQVDAARLSHDEIIAQDRLRTLLGLDAMPAYPLQQPGPEPSISADTESLVRDAEAARPDLRAAELAIEVACKRLGLARWEFLQIAGILDGEEDRGEPFKIGPGVDVEIPIFNRNQGGIARADAALTRAIANHKAVRARVRREVREAHRKYLQAREELDTTRTRILPALTEAVDRAEKAYAGGAVSYLLVLETARQLVDARVREVEAVAALRRARAELERSVGQRLVDEAGPPKAELCDASEIPSAEPLPDLADSAGDDTDSMRPAGEDLAFEGSTAGENGITPGRGQSGHDHADGRRGTATGHHDGSDRIEEGHPSPDVWR